MNYLLQILGFRLKRKLCPLSSSAISLYYILLENFNQVGFPSELPIPLGVLSGEASMSENTVRTARRELAESGFINFRAGSTNRAAVYSLIELDPRSSSADKSDSDTSEFMISASDSDEIHASDSAPESAAESAPESEAEPAPDSAPGFEPGFAPESASLHKIKNKNKSIKINKPPAASPELEAKFNEFWQLYPRKSAYREVQREFYQLNPDDDFQKRLLASLSVQISLNNWDKSTCHFVPSPLNWLKSEGWRNASDEEIDHELRYTSFFETACLRSYREYGGANE